MTKEDRFSVDFPPDLGINEMVYKNVASLSLSAMVPSLDLFGVQKSLVHYDTLMYDTFTFKSNCLSASKGPF